MRSLVAVFALTALLSQAQSLTLAKSSWRLYQHPYAAGGAKNQLPLVNSPTGALSFTFPDAGTGLYANYLYTTHAPNSIAGTLSVTIQINTTGSPVFNTVPGETCDPYLPSAVHPFFWSNNFGMGVNDRWWAGAVSYILASGPATFTVPLTPDQWINVNGSTPSSGGSATLQDFQAALANVSAVGLTFGGGCSFGHGVNVSDGTATFNLLNYAVIP